jgi:hypothetical protein
MEMEGRCRTLKVILIRILDGEFRAFVYPFHELKSNPIADRIQVLLD